MQIVTDSLFVIDGLTKHLQAWEDKGWKGLVLAEMIQDVAARLRSRSAPVTFKWVKGHSGVPGNDGADELAKAGASLEAQQTSSLPPPPRGFVATGVKMTALTQKMAYKSIIEDQRTARKSTDHMIEQIRDCLADDWNLHPHEGAIWKGIRAQHVRRSFRDFWWKAIHGALKIGRYWDNIPGYEQRANCNHCGCLETLEHIILECDAPGQGEIWELAKAILRRREVRMPALRIGSVLAAPILSLKGKSKTNEAGKDRLMQIVLTEAVHLIWKMRCERTISVSFDPAKDHSHREITKRWAAVMNKRLQIDQGLVHPMLGKKAIRREVVLATWHGVLQDQKGLPDDWINSPGVLVGNLETYAPRENG
ncbi:RnaseH-domain-containing protein [Trametes versicolor FP-101664 SS1]|uniref:RnaseH-domain-containing protein n=1 Tax=Trametes versicolor (strain FP-101664) TaxID=717944 RepID=UPI00046228B6|nr:RnaseH-domain-containing protein [Trametes versicolor FP-101664 SS1]EIW64291.1 RnaseH-domain-containing protein [Trametes versicolor FP-101664 SS1]